MFIYINNKYYLWVVKFFKLLHKQFFYKERINRKN